MTVSSQISKNGPYDCNGAQVAFPFSFKVFTKNDLMVVLTDAATEVETDLTVDTNFTVSLNADQNNNPGGTVTTILMYPVGQKITIARNVAATQQVSITNFRPDVFERAFDKLTMLCQQLKEGLDRAIKVKISSEDNADQLIEALDASVALAAEAANQAGASASESESHALDAAAQAGIASGFATQAQDYAQAAANTPVAAPTHAATSKTTPVDADELPLIDSADSWSLKKLTWANLKAALKSYFDTLYNAITATSDPTFADSSNRAASTDWVKGLCLIKNSTAVTTNGAAAYDFSIPAGVNRIILSLSNVSTNGSGNLQVQLASGGALETSGYVGATNRETNLVGFSNGFQLMFNNVAAVSNSGQIIFTRLTGNLWVAMLITTRSDNAASYGTGYKTLAGSIDRLRLTTINGTDLFDSGSANISWEY